MDAKLDKYEFCVLCAKLEEMRAITSVFDECFDQAPGHRRTDVVYKVPSEDDLFLKVAMCPGMGDMNAAVRTTQIITLSQPTFIIFVGTAASLRPKHLQVGDVVVPNNAINRIYEKVTEEGRSDYDRLSGRKDFREQFFGANALIANSQTMPCSPDALGALSRVQADRLVLDSPLGKTFQLGSEEFEIREPKLHDDVSIFSCGMVIDSVSYRDFIADLMDIVMRKVHAIDMESFGFFKSIDAVQRTPVGAASQGLMIRGISDYAGRKDETEARPDDWRGIAVKNAAIVAAQVILELAKLSKPSI
ncbi:MULTISPECIES: 5'-methylthioadenosine/S-adenosylhomocysteine nucleosidase family protein [unclassified Sphingopyxis]|uniref:5'-methylthioadenosine/S-adenosylhomocysteine nucleosidase family protein n=1 Tax=unclassified Sphingopyxis TaxID=2614943 RepID=UPI000A67BADB|nr:MULTISPECIES: hypothetical protein [unclassified Sphingopyxis]